MEGLPHMLKWYLPMIWMSLPLWFTEVLNVARQNMQLRKMDVKFGSSQRPKKKNPASFREGWLTCISWQVQGERSPPDTRWRTAGNSLERNHHNLLHFKKTPLNIHKQLLLFSTWLMQHPEVCSSALHVATDAPITAEPTPHSHSRILSTHLMRRFYQVCSLCSERYYMFRYFRSDNVISNMVGTNIIFLTDAAPSFSLPLAWPDSLTVSSSSQGSWSALLTLRFCNWLRPASAMVSICLASWCRKTQKLLENSKQPPFPVPATSLWGQTASPASVSLKAVAHLQVSMPGAPTPSSHAQPAWWQGELPI